MTTEHTFAKYVSPDDTRERELPSLVRDDPPQGGERENLLKHRVAPCVAMTVRMIMVLPSSHSPGNRIQQWGRLCQNDSWGSIPVRQQRKLPLSDFPVENHQHTGRQGQIV